MDSINAVRLLEDCEKGLQRLVSTAASEGDYGAVIKLTSWARVLGGLVEDAKAELAPAKQIPGGSQASPQRTITGRTGSDSLPSKGSQKARLAGRYPKFFRTSGELMKIGWSKRERAEYHHKAPHSVLMQLVSKLTVVGSGGTIFTADDVFPLGADEGSPVPNYQSYLCLAWLRHEGLVQAHGRQGYSVVNGESLNAAATTHWNELSPYAG